MLFVCSLPNPGKPGAPREFLAHDWAQAKEWARREDKPGRGVYFCPNPLRDGARSRKKETVAAIVGLHVDIDFKDIDEDADEVDRRLSSLPCPPSELRNSGHGRHAWWAFETPIKAADHDYETAEVLLKRLTNCLCADRAPAHPAALLRMPGTVNSKHDPDVRCEVLAKVEVTYSLPDIAAMLDLLADEPVFTCKKVITNEHDHGSPADFITSEKAPVNVQARLAAMQFEGPGETSVNATHCAVIPSLLRLGTHPDDVVEQVVDATMKMAERLNLNWDRQREREQVARRIISAYRNLLFADYDHTTGVIPSWLPGEFHERWIEVLTAGQGPDISFVRDSFHVRAWDVRKTVQSGPRRESEHRGASTADSAAGAIEPIDLWAKFDPPTPAAPATPAPD
jgi:hypothetical protein